MWESPIAVGSGGGRFHRLSLKGPFETLCSKLTDFTDEETGLEHKSDLPKASTEDRAGLTPRL